MELWNDLPKKIVDCQSLAAFKNCFASQFKLNSLSHLYNSLDGYFATTLTRLKLGLSDLRGHQYYNLRYNPSAPFVRSRFLVSYRIRSAIKTTATRTAPHLKYIQGIGIPNKVSFEILAMNTGLN